MENKHPQHWGSVLGTLTLTCGMKTLIRSFSGVIKDLRDWQAIIFLLSSLDDL